MGRLRIPILAFILAGDSLGEALVCFLELALRVGNVCILKSMKIIITGQLLLLLGHYRAVRLEIGYSSVLL